MSNRLDDLFAAYLDRGLTPPEEQELLALLARPELRQRWRLLAQLEGQLQEEVKCGSFARVPRSRRWLRWGRLIALPLGIAAMAVLTCRHFGLFWNRGGTVAVVATISGQVESGTATAPRPLRRGDKLVPGDRLQTGVNGEVVLQYADRTRVTIREESALEVLPAWRSKQLRLRRGVALVDVATQPLSAPLRVVTEHARLTVRGTKFILVAMPEFTRVDVTEGVVAIEASGSQAAREVAAGAAAAVGKGLELKNMPGATREFSARYGGVFYREYAEVYATQGWVLERRPLEPGALWKKYTTRDLLKMAVPGVAGKLVEVRKQGAEPEALEFADPQDQTNRVVFPLTFPANQPFMLEWSLTLAILHSDFRCSFDPILSNSHFYTPTPKPEAIMATKAPNTTIISGKYQMDYLIKFLPVGQVPTGTIIYEVLVYEQGHLTMGKWLEGLPDGFGFMLRGLKVTFGGIDIRHLTVK